MKVIVSGASGFIGSALCDALLSRGDTVVGLTRDAQGARSTNPGVVWHAWEPTLERPPADAFEGVEQFLEPGRECRGEQECHKDREATAHVILENQETNALHTGR